MSSDRYGLCGFSEESMDALVRSLGADSYVLDLGAGAGSFHYASTCARVVSADLSFPRNTQAAHGRVVAAADALPLKEGIFEVIVCNHTLEHFEKLTACIREISRVLKPGGKIWVAVPDWTCPDDRLYQYLFEGGGHINNFTLHSLIEVLEADTGLRAIQYKKLHSGFVYLNPPDPEKLPHYPPRAQRLARIRPARIRFLLRWINLLARFCDRLLGTNTSQYGWGVVFVKDNGPATDSLRNLVELPSDLNVCYHCGAGHPTGSLRKCLRRRGLLRVYDCPQCGTPNFFAREPSSKDS